MARNDSNDNAATSPPAFDTRHNTVAVGGHDVRISNDNGDDNNDHFQAQAQSFRDAAVRYNPMADPKYDARAHATARGTDLNFRPGATSGKSLIGHELTHAVQQR